MKSQNARPGEKGTDSVTTLLDLLIHFLESLKGIQGRAGRIRLFKTVMQNRIPKDDEEVVVTFKPRSV